MTSLTKFWVVVSRTTSSATAAVAPKFCSMVDPFWRRTGGISPVTWSIDGANATLAGPGEPGRLGAGNREDPRRMPGRLQEFHEAVPGDRRGHGVDQRMRIESFLPHHRRAEHDGDPARGVAHQRERRDGPGLDADLLAHQRRGPERQPAGVEATVHAPEVD